MTGLPNDVIQLDKICRLHTNISHFSESQADRMSTRRRANSEESLKSVASVTIEPVNNHNRMDSKRDFVIGLLLLFAVVVLWTASNFITQVRAEGPIITI
jgi:hypothetical protein